MKITTYNSDNQLNHRIIFIKILLKFIHYEITWGKCSQKGNQ